MKKHAPALAALALCAGTAAAQSTVTVYGIVDMAVVKTNDGRSTLSFLPLGVVGRTDSWVMRSATSSRLGFKGTEDLGQGIKANFAIEHRFQPDTGVTEPRDSAAVPAFWNSFSWVGLSGGFGEVRLGRQFVPAFYVALASDPWGYDLTAGGAGGFTRGGNAITMAYNAVSYRSPALSGFTTEIMVAAGEGGAAAVNAPAGRVGRNVGANLQYLSGGLWAGIGYNDLRQENTPVKNRYVTAGIAYDFGFVRPVVSYATGQNNVAGNPRTKTMLIGATAPLGSGRLKMVAARYNAAAGQNFNANNGSLPQNLTAGQDTTKFGLGYEYFLSKRTSVHADIGTAKTDTVSRANGIEAGIKHVF